MVVKAIDLSNFDALRALAGRVDFQFGVSFRKKILDGHERLHLHCDAGRWNNWLDSVISRVETMADISDAERIWLRDEIAHDLGPLIAETDSSSN